jgi:hypothetical protein
MRQPDGVINPASATDALATVPNREKTFLTQSQQSQQSFDLCTGQTLLTLLTLCEAILSRDSAALDIGGGGTLAFFSTG